MNTNNRQAQLQELLAKRAKLDEDIEALRAQVLAEVVGSMREQMTTYGISLKDLLGRKRKVRSDKGVPRKRAAHKNAAAKKAARSKKIPAGRKRQQHG